MKYTCSGIAAGIAALAALLTGCTSVQMFDYGAAEAPMVRLAERGAGSPKSVAVLPVLDQRGVKYLDPSLKIIADERPMGDHGSFYMGFFPLLPAAFVEKEEPERSEDFVTMGRFHFDPQQDLAAAEMVSIKNSGLFDSVVRANSAAETKADYLWRGTLLNSYYRGSILTYCVSYFFVTPLWIVGAPYGVSENELGMRFELIERSSGRVVWTWQGNRSDYIVHWLYARIGKDVSRYPEMMKQLMNEALYSLSKQCPKL